MKRSSLVGAVRAARRKELDKKEREARARLLRRAEEESRYWRPTDWCREHESAETLIVTSASNNTPLCERFWKSLQVAGRHLDARLAVVPVHYRNPTSPPEAGKSVREEWYPDEVREHLFENELHLHPQLWVVGDARVAATAPNPLGKQAPITKGASAVIGHPRIQMRSVATPQHALPKLMYTTGSASEKNYSKSERGGAAKFHHSLGAVIVEKHSGRFYMRSVVGDSDGGFTDLDRYYSPRGVRRAPRAEAVVLGDLHEYFKDAGNDAAVFDEGGIVPTLRPRRVVLHDLIDSYSVMHWHRRDALARYAKYQAGLTLERELESARRFLDERVPRWAEAVVVYSNHDDMIKRWLKDGPDPRSDPANLLIWCQLMQEVVLDTRLTERGTESPNPMALWMAARLERAKVRFLALGESFTVKGIELGMHGNLGPNGARGSFSNLSRIGVRVVGGHVHSPVIEGGYYGVGTSGNLHPDYARGAPSSWMLTHCQLAANGKRQLLHVIADEDGVGWRMPR